MKKLGKKAVMTINQLPAIIMALTISIIFLGAGALVTQEFRDETDQFVAGRNQSLDNATNPAYRAINSSIGAFTKIANFMPLIGLMIAIGVIISIVIIAIAGATGGGRIGFR